MMARYDFVGFDLDGTLVDSKPAFADCLRHVMSYFDRHDMDEMVDVLFPLSLDKFRDVLKIKDEASWMRFRQMYVSRFDSISYQLVQPVDGALDALSKCSQKFGRQNVFLLTNRRLESAEAILSLMQMRDFFGVVAQAPANRSSNPKIAALAALLSDHRQRQRGLYVGDHIKDAEAAIANGLQAVLLGRENGAVAAHDKAYENIITLETLGQLTVILESGNESGCRYFQEPLRSGTRKQSLG